MDDRIIYWPTKTVSRMAISNRMMHSANVVFQRPHNPANFKDCVLVMKNRYGQSGLRDVETFLIEIGLLKGNFNRK